MGSRHAVRGWLRRAVIQAVVVAGLGAVLAVVQAAPTDLVVRPATDREAPERATPTTPVTRLMREHQCWSGDGPGVIPTGAIVARPGRAPRRVPAEVGFRVWEGKAPGTLYGFCP